MDQCKADCIAAEDCQGIEYSLGRCELWIRPEGIGATAEAQGFTCLRYMGAATTTTPRPASFSPVDGGQNRVCRGDSPSDNNPSYFTVASQDSFSRVLSAQCSIPNSSREVSLNAEQPVWLLQVVGASNIIKVEGVSFGCATLELPGGCQTLSQVTYEHAPGSWLATSASAWSPLGDCTKG